MKALDLMGQVLLFPGKRTTSAPEMYLSVVGDYISLTDTGNPALFLLLSGCNFRCTWCDAKFSYGNGLVKHGSTQITAKYILNKLQSPQRLVLTGGEPMMHIHQHNPILLGMLRSIAMCPIPIEVETNGSISPTDAMDILIDHYVVAPKLSNSGIQMSDLYRHNLDQYAHAIEPDRRIFKFVIRMSKFKTDIKDVHKFISDFSLFPHHVFLTPEGTTPESQTQHLKRLAEYCVKEGFGFSPRLGVLGGGR